MTAINGTWRIDANGSQGLLTFESPDNKSLQGQVIFDDTGGREDRIEGSWNDDAGQITFVRHLPGDSVTQNFTGAVGTNFPENLILAGSFTESDISSSTPRSRFGWVAAPLRQAATYSIQLDKFHVNQTRDTVSLPEFKGRDVIYAAFSVQILSQIGYGEIQSVSHTIGPVHNGEDHPTNLKFLVRLQPNEALTFSFLLVNSGFVGSGAAEGQKFLDNISNATKSALNVIYPAEKEIWTVANDLTQYLNSILASGCDGIVAADKVTMTYDQLNQRMPASGNSFSASGEYKYHSQAVCQNPDYTVHWTLTRQ